MPTPPAPAAAPWPLLMRCSPAALRRKLRHRDSPLAPWWRHLVTLARRDPLFFSPYTVLVALVTGAPADRERARRAFMRFVELQREGQISNEAQYHTHVVAAPLGRWALFYDWVADTGILSATEAAAFQAYLLDFALLFPWPQAASRARQFDNQLLSNAFGAAVVGYLLGIRRGDSPAARRLFRTGVDVMRDLLLTRLPPGGYSPEGSTYHEHVVQPLALLCALFLEEATGEGVPGLRQLLATSCRMIAPGGLLPAWDAYGFQQASVKAGLTWLARLTRDPNPLAVIRAGGMWYRTSLPAWELDDRLWTLVLWPEELDPGAGAPAAFPPWMEPEIGGALQDTGTGVRLFQYWDECGGVPSSGRCQVNPNAITLEVGASPLLLDGHGHPGEALVPIPEESALAYVTPRVVESVQEYIFSSWGGRPAVREALRIALDGSLGLSNSLLLDDEGWYVPKAPCRGSGETVRRAGPLQLLASDSTAYYRDRYDVTRVARSSLLIEGRHVLVTDHVRAATPHAVTWQAYLRQEATLAGARAALDSPELVHCDVIPLQPGQTELLPVTGYPRLGDGRSALYRHRVPAAADTRLDVLLAPQPAAVPVADLSPGWTRDGTGRANTIDLRTAYLTDSGRAPAQPRRFRRTLEFAPEAGRRYFVRVPASGQAVRLRVNGAEFAPRLAQEKGHWPGSAETLPHLFEVTSALVAGMNELQLVAPFFRGESVLGPVELLGAVTTAPVTVTADGAAAFRLKAGATDGWILHENEAGEIAWAGGCIAARSAWLSGAGAVAVIDAVRVALPGRLDLDADAPCDLAWTPARTELARWTDGAGVRLTWPGAELSLRTGGCLQVTYAGSAPHRLELHLPRPMHATVNGVAQGVLAGGTAVLALPAATADAPPFSPRTVDDVYALLDRPAAAVASALLPLLAAADWRLQLAAADVAGQLRLAAAVPALLALFAEGERELPYPPLKTWWRASKMLRNPNAVEGDDPDLPLPLGVRRWRVKLAVVMALGRIGDARAVAPLEMALARCTDFFPVTSQLAVALGRLGAASSIPVLEKHRNHCEINTRLHARLALARLRGELGRSAFEARVGLA